MLYRLATEAVFVAGGRSKSNLCNEERLQRIVRRYASDTVSLLLLGLPSHLATHLLLLHSQKLGINVTGKDHVCGVFTLTGEFPFIFH